MMAKWVYRFGGGSAEGRADMRNLLGGKGANLAEMSALGLPVPPGFTITTEVCTYFYANAKSYPPELKAEVEAALRQIEEIVGAKFGDPKKPLLVSVRSGARVSMPGMMDTVLNLGLNDVTVAGLAKQAGDERFAYDSYRRFIQMYGNVVLGVEHHQLRGDPRAAQSRPRRRVSTPSSRPSDWKKVVEDYKAKVEEEIGKPFPQDPKEQLWGAIGAVFGSWMTSRAPSPTAACTTSPRIGAPPSTSRPWCSATWARTAPPASPSPATPRPATTSSTASTWSTRRARTSSPASARRSS